MGHSQLGTWLRPGMFVKRWSLLMVIGVVLFSLSLSMGIAWAYRSFSLPSWFTHLLQVGTWQDLPHPWREIVLFAVGFGVTAFAIWRMSTSLISPLLAMNTSGRSFAQIVAEHRFGTKSPEQKVVVMGGGTGLSTALRGLRHADVDLTAIVTVTDDGGSTGRLRQDFSLPAPGDIRNCIVALADDASTMGRLFNYRFDQAGSDLTGHSLGNLFITALSQVTGNFEQAVIESGRVLNISGQVLPTTLEDVGLAAELTDGTVVVGESNVGRAATRIRRVMIEPAAPRAYGPSIDAILAADIVVLGPGSLFTSVIPNLLVRGVREALMFSRARVVYVCNVATQPGETSSFSVEDHISAMVDHLGEGIIDFAIVNDRPVGVAVDANPLWLVSSDGEHERIRGVRIVRRHVVDDSTGLHHDPDRLCAAILDAGAMKTERRERSSSTLAAPDQVTA